MKQRVQKYKVKIIVALFLLVSVQAIISYSFSPESSSAVINGLLKQSLLNAKSEYSVLRNKFFKKDSQTGYGTQNANKGFQNKNLNPVVIIHFDGVPSNLLVSKAPLKYNKHFAYSLTLDDGKDNAYTAAYPLLAGGYSSETGATYPGLFYTDGCGNNIPFKAGVAMGSVNSQGEDTHLGTPGTMTWEQVKDLYNKDWDVFNHGYSHSSGAGTNYKYEVEKNNSYIKSKTDIDLTHFVIPSGDGNYTQYAFNAGMKAVYNQNIDFPGLEGFNINSPIALTKFKLYRQFLNDDDYATQSGKIDQVASKSNSSEHYWYSEFTHHVSVKKQGGSLLFSTFKSHMESLENKYGSKGLDNIWVAPLQEVYEYLSVRESSLITSSMENNKSYQNVNFNSVPTDLRRYSMTLIVNSDQNISDVECSTASKITFKGSGDNKIINIEWNKHPFEIATGINDPKFGSAIMNIYPNPVEDEVTLNFSEYNLKDVVISIIDQTGTEFKLGRYKVINGSVQVNLKALNLKKGSYIVKAFSTEEKLQFSRQILKN